MGKGSGTCDRPAVSLEASDRAKTESTLSGVVAGIDTTLKLQVVKHRWFTRDGKASFKETSTGWEVWPGLPSNQIRQAFREYGLINYDPKTDEAQPTPFPSLTAARKAVRDVSLEAGLGIDASLTRQKYISYGIGDLPLAVKKVDDYWAVSRRGNSLFSQSLKNYFNSSSFWEAWESTDSAFAHYPTRKAAHQAVTNWLAQTIAVGK